jgi:hypothetical protein
MDNRGHNSCVLTLNRKELVLIDSLEKRNNRKLAVNTYSGKHLTERQSPHGVKGPWEGLEPAL